MAIAPLRRSAVWLFDATSRVVRVCNDHVRTIQTPCRRARLTWVGDELWIAGTVDQPIFDQACLFKATGVAPPP